MDKIKGITLFSGGGIGETYLKDLDIDIKIANELLESRANFYQYCHEDTNMICGDITKEEIRKELIERAKKEDVKLLIATPPCQGMSNLGKREYDTDERNYLIFRVFEIIDNLDLNYILIENVPKFLNMYYPYNGKIVNILDILNDKYGNVYNIDAKVFDAQYYGVPQRRKRAIVRLWKKDLKWEEPKKETPITLRQAIGYLPSIESEEDSGILYHKGSKISPKHIEVLQHTPTGKSAHKNEIYYPKKEDGTKVKGYDNTYRRLEWDKVCPTRTMNSGSVSGSNNVHPGRLREDGLYSDARTLSLLELFIVSSLPKDWNIPTPVNEHFVREVVGEGVPPMLMKNILKGIF